MKTKSFSLNWNSTGKICCLYRNIKNFFIQRIYRENTKLTTGSRSFLHLDETLYDEGHLQEIEIELAHQVSNVFISILYFKDG